MMFETAFLIKYGRECIIGILILIIGYYIFHSQQQDNALLEEQIQCTSQIQSIETAQRKALDDANNKANEASSNYEKLRAEQHTKTEYITRQVTKYIDRPIYNNSCIDDDGRMQLNTLIGHGKTNNPE